MVTELDKPLGIKTKTKDSGGTNAWALTRLFVAVALIVMAGAGGYAWKAHNAAHVIELASADDPVEIAITNELIRQTSEVDDVHTGTVARPLDQQSGSAELKPLNPSGSLITHKPLKSLPKVNVRQKQILAHLPDQQLAERGATGIIPRKSPDGLRAMDVYSRQPATEGNFGVARVVIVVAGMGISQTSTNRAIQKLPGDVTLAFAPYGNSLLRWMQKARKSGHELLLQVPMEPYGYPQNNPGIHTLRTDAGVDENLANMHWAMSRITNYVGIMNYQGGKLLTDAQSLKPLFDDISDRGLLFLEDGTVKNSAGKLAAGRSLLPFARAHIQIDNVRSRAAIAEKLNKLADEARRTGLAIGVANAFPDSIDMIAEFAQQAKLKKLEITPVSAVVLDPQNPN